MLFCPLYTHIFTDNNRTTYCGLSLWVWQRYEGHPINRENFLILKEFYHLNITNVSIMWHNLLRMQQHIRIVDGKWGRVMLSNEQMILKGTATLMISMFHQKELYEPWILIQVSSKSIEKWTSYRHLKNFIWPTFSRHFEYFISFQNFFNCLIFS